MGLKSLSKRSAHALTMFDEAARDWGWTSDQGSGHAVNISQDAYEASRRYLRRRLLYLEGQVAKLKVRGENTT